MFRENESGYKTIKPYKHPNKVKIFADKLLWGVFIITKIIMEKEEILIILRALAEFYSWLDEDE